MIQVEANENLITFLKVFLRGSECALGLNAEQRERTYRLAEKHDVAHLVAVVLERTERLEADDPFRRAKQTAIFRYAKQEYERERIYREFEQAGLAFLPLKGSVIAELYPEAWQRTGCDIDVLVHPEDLNRAVDLLTQSIGCSKGKVSEHDVSLITPGGVHLELHYDLHEKEVENEAAWASARLVSEGGVRYALSEEVFLLHHLAHMAKHCRIGGCGLRPFIDLWVLRERMCYDPEKLAELLRTHGLAQFADAAFGLVDYWFGDGASTPVLQGLANYILPAGVFGNVKNKVAVGQVREGGKIGYFWSRLFLSREALEYPYPILKKHGWLLPFCQVHRWIKLLLDGKWRKITRELGTNSGMDRDYKDGVAWLLEELGL